MATPSALRGVGMTGPWQARQRPWPAHDSRLLSRRLEPVCGDALALFDEVMPEFARFDAEGTGTSVDGVWRNPGERTAVIERRSGLHAHASEGSVPGQGGMISYG